MQPLRLLHYCVFLFLLISVANGQPMESIKTDGSTFSDTPFISVKWVLDVTPSTPHPQYPLEARKKTICGEVVMAVKIGVDGRVIDSKILKSEPLNVFDKAVTRVISKWKYKRVTFNGEPVIYQTESKFKFHFEGEDGAKCAPNSSL